jgi:hypothetical protein
MCCRKCKTKIKKSFTKILTIILSVKIVLTLRVKLPCPKCKILIVRKILVLSFIVSEKNRKKDGRCIKKKIIIIIMKKEEFSPSLQVVFSIVDRSQFEI